MSFFEINFFVRFFLNGYLYVLYSFFKLVLVKVKDRNELFFFRILDCSFLCEISFFFD